MSLVLAAILLAGGSATPAIHPVTTISTGGALVLEHNLLPQKPTVFLFYQDTSSADRSIAEALTVAVDNRKGALGLRLIRLHNLVAPAARAYEIRETPTLIALDRFGRLIRRSSNPDEIIPLADHAAHMARIKWVDESDSEAAKAYAHMGGGRQPVAGILKTMSLRPELMEGINRIAGMAHFTSGFLPRKTKEMIATYVSAINHCKF